MIEHREALIYMLYEAAELEHGIMGQYLFAAFSLKQTAAEGLTAEQLEAVPRWRKQISHVARGQDFATVGHLYRSIEAGFAHLAARNAADWLFAWPPAAQATQAHFGWPELVPVTDLASAQRAIGSTCSAAGSTPASNLELTFSQVPTAADAGGPRAPEPAQAMMGWWEFAARSSWDGTKSSDRSGRYWPTPYRGAAASRWCAATRASGRRGSAVSSWMAPGATARSSRSPGLSLRARACRSARWLKLSCGPYGGVRCRWRTRT